MQIPKFSVVTVTLNALSLLPETESSLRRQTCADYEWIVQDGESIDGTKEWLRAASPSVLVSERDEGIYDAMNRAVMRCNGEWVYFLNAGDQFADSRVLDDVASALQGDPLAEVVYGDVVYFGKNGKRRRRFHWVKRRNLVFGDLCHQAVFVRRSLFLRHGLFDSSLRWNADFDWFLKVFRSGVSLLYVQRDIANFQDAGAHVQAAHRSAAERNVVRGRYIPLYLWRSGNWALRIEHKIRRLAGQEV